VIKIYSLNRLSVIGILMIIVGAVVWRVSVLHGIATSLFWPLTLGSDETKAVILLVVMGSFLVFNSLITSGRFKGRFASLDFSGSKKYLKYAVILVLFTLIVGQICEVLLRLEFGVPIFSVFVSVNPSITSSSIIHSHVFKSVLGYMVTQVFGVAIPSYIGTGESLFKYISPLKYVVIVTWPLIYVTCLISMDKRMDLYKLIIAFAGTLALIGILDGGLFSNPAIIGFAGLIGMYFIEKLFSPRNLIKPTLIVLIIILVGVGLEIGGSNPDYHQITVIHPTQPVDLNGYDVLSIKNYDNESIIDIKTTTNDKETLLNLYHTFKGKADGFFMTWNFYSYF
jgi:hypothetical protein